MVFTGQTISVVVAALVGTPAVTTFLVRKFGKAAPVVERVIETAASGTAHLVEDLAKTPWFAGIAAVGKLEVHHVVSKLTDSKQADKAKEILVAIGKDYSVLSESERVKAAVLLRLAFSAVGVTLTDKQIEDTFTGAQKAVDELRGDAVYKATFATHVESPAVAQA